MSHTPKPWRLAPSSFGGLILVRGTDARDHPQSHLQIVPEEDARLIAASPDLLSAAEELLVLALEQLDEEAYGKIAPALKTLDTAAKKARGEA